MFVWVA